MYDALLQSNNRPFRATPDKKFYFKSESVENARQTAMRATLRAEGPVMVLGGAGLGKSLLANLLAQDLGPRFDIVSLHAAQLCSRRALLQNILFELGLPYRDLSEGELRLSILDRLVPSPETAPDGVLVIVDEAQTLPIKLLDELRLITNFTRNNQPRARLILLGSLKLEDIFAQPQLDSFNQRLAARCYLQPMTRGETHNYIRHQLAVAKVDSEQCITAEAIDIVYSASDGLPRLTNQLMDHALVLAAAANNGPITPATIEEAWADLQQLPAPWHSGEEARSAGSEVEFGGLDEAGPIAAESILESTAVGESDDDFHAVEFGPVVAEQDLAPVALDFARDSEGDVVVPEEFEKKGSPEVQSVADTTELTITTSEIAEQLGSDLQATDELYTSEFAGQTSIKDNLTIADTAIDESVEPNFFAAFSAPSDGDSGVIEIDSAIEVGNAALQQQAESTLAEIEVSVETEPANAFDEPGIAAADSEPAVGLEADTASTPIVGFFDNKPTDEQLLAFADEQAQFDSMAVWENDPPLADIEELGADAVRLTAHFESEDDDENQATVPEPKEFSPVHAQALTSSQQVVETTALFGDDFEEEVALSDSVDATQFTGSQVTATQTGSTQFDTGVSAELEELSIATPETETEQAVDPEPTARLASETPAAIADVNEDYDDGSSAEEIDDQNWSVEVASIDIASEVALHGEIEDIVSQLNFSAFSVEPYSVEQLAEQSDTAEAPEDSVRRGRDDEVYLLHRPLADGRDQSDHHTSDHDSGVLVESADYDDDRDLLVIEEDIPVIDRSTTVDTTQPATQTMGYSQLFAKLRR